MSFNEGMQIDTSNTSTSGGGGFGGRGLAIGGGMGGRSPATLGRSSCTPWGLSVPCSVAAGSHFFEAGDSTSPDRATTGSAR